MMKHSALHDALPVSPMQAFGLIGLPASTRRSQLGLADLEAVIRFALDATRLQKTVLDSETLTHPGWEILLQVALAQAEQKRITTTGVCEKVGAPPSTVSRWIKHMDEQGLLARKENPVDARVKYVELNDDTVLKMRAYLTTYTERVRGL